MPKQIAGGAGLAGFVESLANQDMISARAGASTASAGMYATEWITHAQVGTPRVGATFPATGRSDAPMNWLKRPVKAVCWDGKENRLRSIAAPHAKPNHAWMIRRKRGRSRKIGGYQRLGTMRTRLPCTATATAVRRPARVRLRTAGI